MRRGRRDIGVMREEREERVVIRGKRERRESSD